LHAGFTSILQGKYYDKHFIDKETKDQKMEQATQRHAISGRDRILTQDYATPKPTYFYYPLSH
jgi:hypothetical protein